MTKNINIPKLLTAMTIGTISSQAMAGEKIEIKSDIADLEIAKSAKEFIGTDKESKDTIMQGIFQISENIELDGTTVVKNIDALKAYASDSTNTSTYNGNTRWNNYNASNCYTNCYTNCYGNCHGSRGWR